MRYGIRDTRDEVWIGNDAGPLAYDDFDIAQVAARMADRVMGFAPGRCRAEPLPDSPWKLRDHVEQKMTPLAALIGLEEGLIP